MTTQRNRAQALLFRIVVPVASVALQGAGLAGLGGLSVGCGGLYYAVTVNAAESRLEEARQLGAETHAPYEYYYAKKHLEEASVEASEASYSDAAEYAEVAEQYAIKAIELSRKDGAKAVSKEPVPESRAPEEGRDEDGEPRSKTKKKPSEDDDK